MNAEGAKDLGQNDPRKISTAAWWLFLDGYVRSYPRVQNEIYGW